VKFYSKLVKSGKVLTETSIEIMIAEPNSLQLSTLNDRKLHVGATIRIIALSKYIAIYILYT